MNRHILQLLINHQAEEQAAGAEEQSDHQKGMSVYAEKTHARQIRQHQAGFASARVFLRAGECGKQQAQKGRHNFIPTLQKCPRDLQHRWSTVVRADNLARKEKGRDER